MEKYLCPLSSIGLEQEFCKLKVVGSSPTEGSKIKRRWIMLFIIDWIREGLISLVESTSEELVREEFKELIEKNEVEVLPVAYA